MSEFDLSSAAVMEAPDDVSGILSNLYDDEPLNDCHQRLLHHDAYTAMMELVDRLGEKRRDSTDLEWNRFVKLCRLHPVCRLIHQDPFSLRAFEKPRGYAGDACLMDFIYGVDDGLGPPPGTTDVGREVFRAITNTEPCHGVRFRGRYVAEVIDDLARATQRPSVLSVAAGHLREANRCEAIHADGLGRWVAFDSDTDSLQEVRRSYGHLGVETVAGTVRQLLCRKFHHLGQFDLVYSTGLYDYLEAPVGARLTSRLFEMVRPGGQLLIANFLTGISGRGYMEAFMDWNLIYRDSVQMQDLVADIDSSAIDDHDVQEEDMRQIVFLRLTKSR